MTEQLKPCPFCGREQMADEERGDVFAYRGQRRSCDFCGVITVNWNNRPLETALRARIAELEALLSKQAESDNDFHLVCKEHSGGNCPRCGDGLITMLFCVNKSCVLYTTTGAEYQARIEELEADIERLLDSDNANVRDLAIANATIIELKAENAALRAKNAEHDWWGGGGR